MAFRVHFWDMDHTIINNDCDVSWKEFMIFKGLATEEAREKADFFYQQYLDKCLDIDAFLRFQLEEVKGKTVDEVKAWCVEHYEKFAKPKMYTEAQKLIDEQKAAGDVVCLVTATNRLIAEPVAAAFGLEHVLATELETEGGKFTGSHAGEYCCGAGKLVHMNAFLAKFDKTLADCSYYGDSSNDVPVLEAVGFPFAANPSDGLRKHSQEHGWTILDFEK
ncbi:MAG: HAD-IB family hydrolase [Lentisphaeraceae bacterium]|nr:HAD-IB family hydrolase [Lentisphaeraceae bacterium]